MANHVGVGCLGTSSPPWGGGGGATVYLSVQLM